MRKQKQGVALIWSLVLSAILLLISGTMVSYIVKESQFSVRITDSTVAYSHAKSGIAWANNCIENGGNETECDNSFDLDGDSVNDIVVDTSTGDCQGGATAEYCIESTGSSSVVTRKLEYEITPSTLNRVTPSSLGDTNIGSNTESFTFQFDFWAAEMVNPSFVMGVDNISGGDIGFKLVNGTMAIVHRRNAAVLGESENIGTIDVFTDPIEEPYAYRVRIEYVKDTAIQITVMEREVGGSYSCKASGVADVSGIDFGNLDTLYFGSDNPTYETEGTEGDGEYIDFSDVFVDNIYTSTVVE